MTKSPSPIRIEISPGELIDRLTILRLKVHHLRDGDLRRERLAGELRLLEAEAGRLSPSGELAALAGELAEVNASLWGAEDKVRGADDAIDLADAATFAALARTIFHANDRRAAIKRGIDALLGARLTEAKIYRRRP